MNAGGDAKNPLEWAGSSGFARLEKITNDLVRAIAAASNIVLRDELAGGEGAIAFTATPRDPSEPEPSGPDGVENCA